MAQQRRPSHEGRGLKFVGVVGHLSGPRRPSHEGRGLKCRQMPGYLRSPPSSLSRGTWIEIPCADNTPPAGSPVVPLTRDVD